MRASNRPFALGLAALGLVLATSGCATKIPVASVGVKFNATSGVSQRILKPEVVWVNPFTEKLVIYPTSINNATYVRASHEGSRWGDDSVRASTVEGAILPVDVTVAFRIPADAENVMQVFNNFGTMELKDIEHTHIRWATQAAINEVSGRKSIFDLISRQRAQFGPEVKVVLAPRLAKWGFAVEDVLIREVYPPEEITAKIQEQQAIRSDLEKAKVEKQQAAIDAQTVLMNAQKEAEQNRLLAQQGNTALQLRRLELRRKAIEKWDGQSPIIGSAGIPFFDAKW
ncbi:MAG: band 7 protein [Armatimonadetes bacterium]|nr:band 7 protein [Armatimonadota bacterium]